MSNDVQTIAAREINATHIGSTVRFEWNFPVNDVHVIVCDELRQYSGDSNMIYLNLSGINSNGDLQEFELEHHTPVEVVK